MFKKLSGEALQRSATKFNINQLSTVANTIARNSDSFRTLEDNPLNQSSDQIGKFYQISAEIKKKLFLNGGIPKSYNVQMKTFAENALMIRKPALNIIKCLKALDYTKPVVRFVLYGEKGTGKSLSLAHILHYGHMAGFLVVHVPWVGSWMRRCKENSNSTTREGNVDLPLDAAAWLIHFKTQNSHILTGEGLKNLTTSQDYNWSKRETTPKGAPLLELIDHGINRVKYASDCVVILADELKKLTVEGKCKTLVAIDGFNAFFYPNTRVYTEKKEAVPPSKVTLTEAFLNLTKADWCNAVCVLTVDELAVPEEAQQSHFPVYLLGKPGFEHIDPFCPVPVVSYDKKELSSCMDYFRERKWVGTPPAHDEELALLSFYNPYKLMQICAPL